MGFIDRLRQRRAASRERSARERAHGAEREEKASEIGELFMTASFVNALAQEGRLGEFADQLRSGFISQGFDSSLAPDPHAYAEMANLDKLVPRALEIADGDFSLLDRAFSTREIQELVRRTEGGSRRMADPTEVKQDEYLRGVRAALHSPRWQSRWNEK